jgi:hypothetical protein
MRINKFICPFAFLGLAGASHANATAADPNSDFDCAVVFDFFHRVAESKPALADLRAETAIMNSWFIAKYVEHPDKSTEHREHYMAMVKDLGENGRAYGGTLKTCTARANSDPLFDPFVKAFRETEQKVR